MSEARIRSIDLRPGDVVQYGNDPATRKTIKERKTAQESQLSGWWLVEGGGLADRAFDDPDNGPWTLVKGATRCLTFWLRVWCGSTPTETT